MPSREPTADVPAARPFQFRLSHLLLLTIGCAVLLALLLYWGRVGFIACYVVACLSILIWGTVQTSNKWSAIGYGMLFVGVVGSCLMPLPGDMMTPSRQGICRLQLMQISLALQNYHDVYGSFPPAYVADATGKPMHSWRVLILPFAEQKNLYDAYNFNEPWDGPNNHKLHSQRPPYFCCPSSHKQQPGWETNYLAVLGPNTMWPGAVATKLSDFADGVSNTLMVVEVHNSGIHWMEPRDLHVVQMPPTINAAKGTGISSAHLHGAQAVFADGHSQFLNDDLPPETLRRLLTIAGGEKVEVP